MSDSIKRGDLRIDTRGDHYAPSWVVDEWRWPDEYSRAKGQAAGDAAQRLLLDILKLRKLAPNVSRLIERRNSR